MNRQNVPRSLPLIVLVALGCAGDRAETTASPDAPTTTTAAVQPIAPPALHVRVVGTGKPMILIPGLTCSGEVWDATVEHFAGRYQAHIVTLAGFAGEPAIGAPFMPRVREELVAYIRDQQLDHPVVIGHSLGGFMALWLAATAPDVMGPVVAVDGVPFLSALMDPAMTAESSQGQAEQMRAMMSGLTPEQFAMQNQISLRAMIEDPEQAAVVAKRSDRSDPAAVGQAVYELMTTDIRPQLAAVRSPVLMIAAGAPAADASARTALAAQYEAQIALVPEHQVVVAAGAKHFVMLDDPTFFYAELDRFLGGAPR